ncbi:MAG TPA: lamin tail domain-containing protein, partial [Polyangiaceae bacterium]|nr:lamin tail domain-containing protein [Polyangiaceae bacterium]
ADSAPGQPIGGSGRGGSGAGGSSGVGGSGGSGGSGGNGSQAGAGAAGDGQSGSAQGAGGGGGESGAGASGSGSGGGLQDCAKVIINEVQPEGPEGGDDEFIELFNAGSCAVSLDGFAIDYLPASTQGGYKYWQPKTAGRSLEPGKFFLIASTGYSGPVFDDQATISQGMAKTGGGIVLSDGGQRLDSIAWGSAIATHPHLEGAAPAAAAPEGQSIGRNATSFDSNNNASDFSSGTPSPGALNTPLPLPFPALLWAFNSGAAFAPRPQGRSRLAFARLRFPPAPARGRAPAR